MDPLWWRTASYVVVFVGTALVLAGSVGTWYFGNLVEAVAPFRAPIRSASATVEVFIQTDEPYDAFYMDRGGYLAFGKGNMALLTAGGNESLGKQQGGSRALFRGIFKMDATDAAVGQSVASLRNAEFIRIEFFPMPKDAHVLSGRAVVTVNSAVRIEIDVPQQDIRDGKIIVRGIDAIFRDFK